MRVYPYARNDTVLDSIALRLAGADTSFNASIDRLDLIPPENGEPVVLEARVNVNIPKALEYPLVPKSQPLSLLAVARCRETRWAKTIKEWQIPIHTPAEAFVPDNELLTIDSGNVSGNLKLIFCLCLGSDRANDGQSFARRRLNIIAEKRFSVLMSGSGGSITEWVSFKDRTIPSGLWYLSVPGGNLDQPATELRMYLNKDCSSFHRLLSATSATKPDRVLAHTLARRMIRAAFIYNILTLGFTSDEKDIPQDEDSWSTTCWGVAFNLCSKIFRDQWDEDDPYGAFLGLRKQYGQRLNLLETQVQSYADLPSTLDRSHTLNPTGTL